MHRRLLFTSILLLILLASMVPAALAQGPTGGLVTAAEPGEDGTPPVEEAVDLSSRAGIDAVATQYTFSSSSGTYTEIISGTVHGTASNDDTSFPAINLGFTFRYNNVDYTQVGIQSNGWIALGPGTMSSSYYPLSTGTMNNVIAALARDLQGNGTTSELRSLTEGTAPNRVFTVQWKDYKRYGTSYVGDAFDFQIKLHETSNLIEVVYGAFTVLYVAAPPYGPQVGLRGNSNADFNNRAMDASQSWVTSVAGTTNADAMLLTDLIYPPSGLTYAWALATGVFIDPSAPSGGVCPGSDVVYNLTVINQTGAAQSFTLSYTNVWPTSGPAATGVIPNNGTEAIVVTVHIPWAANTGDSDLLTLVASGGGYTGQATAKTTAILGSDWNDYANVPVGREVRAPSVVYWDGKLFKIGGYGYVSGTGAARAWVDIYDIATNSWTAGADMPAARYWINCEAIAAKIYCGGGYLSASTNTLYIYDIATNTWTTGATLPANRYDYASVQLGGKYYLIGGYTTAVQATMIVYDPATNTWDSSLASMATARRYFHAGVIAGKIYVAGGYGVASPYYLSSAEVYDPALNTWTYVASMPTTWVNGADGVKHDRFLVIAGGHPSSSSGASNGALYYDAVNNTWEWLPLLDRMLYSAEGDVDGSGEFWYVSGRMYDGATWSNSPYTTRLVQCAACTPVSGADFTVDPTSPRPNVPAQFSGTVAGGSPPITWAWDFGDGTYGSGQVVTHTYTVSATYTAVMTASNCDAASVAVATHPVTVMPGPLAVVSPLSLEATTCPDGQTTQELSICNEGDLPLDWTLNETTTGGLLGTPEGIESLSGSFVVFDPSVGGNTQFQNGVPGTFCFRAESFTNDWEYRYLVWLKFPTDWTVSNAYMVGTPWCQSGSTWSGFVWGWESAPYELVIDHRAYNQSADHCVATYCVDATPGPSQGDALVSWYWSGDGYGGAPHHPCSSEVYTPASMASAPCDQAINPRAAIPWLDTSALQWLTENPSSGTVAVGECTTVTVTYDATGLTAGLYTGTLEVNTNDILNPYFAIPVELTVAGPPTNPAFTSTPADPYIGQEVTFAGSADALMPIDYSWDFGDGTTGTGQNPTHAYTAAGTFMVTMTATECGSSVSVTGTVTVQPCYQLVHEDFEGSFPPADWAVINNGGTCAWSRNDAFATPRPNYAGGLGFCADADSDKCGSGTTMDTELRTMVLDLSTVHTATLSYMTSYNDLSTGGDYADVDVSVDGGATWSNLLHWDEDHSPNGPGELVTLDLTPYAGYFNVMLRFHYYLATYDWWWEVDQVDAEGCFVPGVYPDIDVAPSTLAQTLFQHQTADQTFTIDNLGTPPLGWTTDVGCGTPVSWLSVSPASGAVLGGGTVTPTVTFDSDSLATGTYTADICINSNDPDEPTVQVAATLIVTGTPDIAVAPPSLSAEQCADTQTVQQLQVCNNGTADLEWTLTEQPLALAGHETIAATPGMEAQMVPGPANRGIDPAIVPPTHRVPEDILISQPPNQANGIFVDAACSLCPTGMQSVADNFVLDQYVELTNIVFWSGYFSADTPIDPDLIRVRIHQDAGGVPGAVVYDESNVAYSRVQTGVILFGVHEWMHTLTLATPVDLPAGVYWVELYNNTGTSGVDFFWEVGTLDPAHGLYDSVFATETPGVTWYANGGNDMALQLIGTPVVLDIPWLSESSTAGTVLPGECATVDVTFDSTGLVPDVYNGNLVVTSNDPDEPEITVPVTLTVLEPVSNAEFTWAPVAPLVYDTVYFSGTASGSAPLTWSWDFGDGGTATGQYAYHAYIATGDYLVTLAVSNGCGESVVTHTIAVTGSADLVVTPTSLAATQCPDTVTTQPLTICNQGLIPLDWTLTEAEYTPGTVAMGDPLPLKRQPNADTAPTSRIAIGPLALGDLLFEIDFGAITADSQVLGVEFDGTYYWVTGGNSGLDPNKLYKIDTAGTLVATYDQASLAGWGWRDLAFDGVYLYASDSGTVQQIDPATGAATGVTIPSPINPARALAYDPATDHFWAANWDSNLYEFDRTGAIVNSFPPVGLSTYGMAWDSWSAGGPTLWLWSQDGGDPALMASQVNPTTGALTGVSFLGVGVAGEMAGGAAISDQIVPGVVTFLGINQGVSDRVGVYELTTIQTDLIPWLSEDPTSGSVPPGECTVVDVTFDSTGLTAGDYFGALLITSNDPDTPTITVPVQLTVTTPPDLVVTAPPLEAELCPSQTTTLEFSLCNGGECLLDYEITEIAGTGVLAATLPNPTGTPRGNQPVVLSLASPEALGVETNAPIVDAPVSLILDDGSVDNNIGIGGTWEFIYLNRFTPAAVEFPFLLNEVQVYFSSQGLAQVGDDIIVVVYENTTGGYDPAVGSNWLYSYPTTVQAIDAWNSYTLPVPVPLNGPGDVLIGVVALEVPGTSYWPAAIDQTATQQRSWAGWWLVTPPPNPPILPPDDSWILIDDYFPGNWMIRGFGETNEVDIVPWLSEVPIQGSLVGGECVTISVTFDSTGMAPGVYYASLLIESNDPDMPSMTLPVTLTVDEAVSIVDVVTSTNGLEVTFTPTVAGTEPIDYMWDFGDGSTSTETNPVHTYAAGGCYDVSLDVANGCGLDGWVGLVCVCDPVHDASFVWAPTSPFVDDTVVFTATASGTDLTYAWDFGDGGTDTGMVVSYAYTVAGTYTVTLTVEGACGDPLVLEHAIVVQPHEVEQYTIYLPILYK